MMQVNASWQNSITSLHIFPWAWITMLLSSVYSTSLLTELSIIVLAYWWARSRHKRPWIIPCLLAVSPGLIANTMWWGQNDALVGLFVVLSLIALNRDRPR